MGHMILDRAEEYGGWFVIAAAAVGFGLLSWLLPCFASTVLGREGDMGSDCRPDEPLQGEKGEGRDVFPVVACFDGWRREHNMKGCDARAREKVR